MERPQKPQIAVRALIANSKGEILILKRANTSCGNGFWNLPGGKIDFGDTAIDSIKKEIYEETALQCENTKFLFFLDNLPSTESNLHFVTLFFKCECAGNVLINEESSNFKWIAQNELDKYQLAFDNDKAITTFFNL